MSATVSREAAKAKIAKLMAMATHEKSNQFEAEAALRQAAALMKKHAIEQAEIADATGRAPEYDWCTVHVPADPKNPGSSTVLWLGTLGLAIGTFTDTKVVWSYKGEFGMCLSFSGDAIDVEYAVWLAKHLRDQIRFRSSTYPGDRSSRETFRRAMVHRIADRMEDLTRAKRDELRNVQTCSGTALVLVDRKIALRDEQFGEQKSTRRQARRRYDATAQHAGTHAGDHVHFNRPLGNSTRALGAGDSQ